MSSSFVKHVPCPRCGSKDSGALYDDGHVFCFSACQRIVVSSEDLPGDEVGYPLCTETTKSVKYKPMTETNVIYKGIPERGITKETCEKYGVRVVGLGAEHQYPYHGSDGKEVGTKIRKPGKKFSFEGDSKAAVLFGQQLFLQGGKYVTIYEGELDALSGFQMTGSLYPSVSIKNGASGALKDCKAQFEWLDSFENIVICFDSDEPGQKAAREVAELFGSKAKIVKHLKDYKDASDYLQKGATKAFVDAWWRAEEYRPEGIVTVKDLHDSLRETPKPGTPWCFPTLDKLTYGRRPGELYAFGAGVGIGKTDVFTQSIAYDITELGLKVGVIYLEQPVRETVQRIAGKIAKQRFHKPDAGWTREEYLAALDDLEARDQLYMLQHFGAMEWDVIKSKIKYFAKAYDIKHIYLDHLTALSANESDERRALDGIMADMASLAQADGLIIHFISHLTTPDGLPHEEGGRVLEKHFTGSRAIARWAHFMFGLERNKQETDPIKKQTTTFRVLKDRHLGDATGERFGLFYDKATGILTECTLDMPEEAL